jgi:hypothetical protein
MFDELCKRFCELSRTRNKKRLEFRFCHVVDVKYFAVTNFVNEMLALLEYYATQIAVTDVLEQPIGPIFNGQTDTMCRNVGTYQSTMRNIPRFYLHRYERLESRILRICIPPVRPFSPRMKLLPTPCCWPMKLTALVRYVTSQLRFPGPRLLGKEIGTRKRNKKRS